VYYLVLHECFLESLLLAREFVCQLNKDAGFFLLPTLESVCFCFKFHVVVSLDP
jgi:hypothetical protein